MKISAVASEPTGTFGNRHRHNLLFAFIKRVKTLPPDIKILKPHRELLSLS